MMPNPIPFRAWSPTFGQIEPDGSMVYAYSARQAAEIWQERWDLDNGGGINQCRKEPTQVHVMGPDSSDIKYFLVNSVPDVKYVGVPGV
jgi:hypothetical protein